VLEHSLGNATKLAGRFHEQVVSGVRHDVQRKRVVTVLSRGGQREKPLVVLADDQRGRSVGGDGR
jgi:hypothetical protein